MDGRDHPAAGVTICRMDLTFLGAAGTVTGSRYLVQHDGVRVLVDCGLFQGYKQLRLRNWAALPVPPGSLDAVVLTHAHLDHSGYLPLLVKQGFRGPVFCTEATLELCKLLLPDSAHLQEEEALYANRRGYSKHHPALPLYSTADADAALRRLTSVAFNAGFEPARGFTARFDHAGHILGAAMVSLHAGARDVLFSGDLGRPHDPVMYPPATVAQAGCLVLECTYGDRLHDQDDPGARLADVIARTAARGGMVIIPAFAVARAQAILYHLEAQRAKGAIPPLLPIYLDSPMATDVTELYERFHEEHRLTAAESRRVCRIARFVNTPAESRRVDEQAFPMVIIAASGMATGGRVLHHLARFAPDPRSTIVLTGYQAGGTRGAALQAGAKSLRIHGEEVPVRAEVVTLGNLSAHADWAEIVEWLRHFRSAPRAVYLTHGDPGAADALRLHIRDALGWDCTVPDHLQRVEL
jgi:metallo-beta-lactamase family protein